MVVFAGAGGACSAGGGGGGDIDVGVVVGGVFPSRCFVGCWSWLKHVEFVCSSASGVCFVFLISG